MEPASEPSCLSPGSLCAFERVFGEFSRAGMFGGERRTFEKPKQSTCYEIWVATDKTSIRLPQL